MLNYFKVVVPGRHTSDTFIPFDDTDVGATKTAYHQIYALANRLDAKVAVLNHVPAYPEVSTVGEGIDGCALRSFSEGSYSDDGDNLEN